MTNLQIAEEYLRAIERRDDATRYFSYDVVQREYPNRLVPNGATRDLTALKAARAKGRRVVNDERYEIVSAVEQGEKLAMELIWTATLAVPVGALREGDTMRAHFGVFLTFRDGEITSQNNYDCFDPF